MLRGTVFFVDTVYMKIKIQDCHFTELEIALHQIVT